MNPSTCWIDDTLMIILVLILSTIYLLTVAMGRSTYFLGSGDRRVQVTKGTFLTVQARLKKLKISRKQEKRLEEQWSCTCSPKSAITAASIKTTKRINRIKRSPRTTKERLTKIKQSAKVLKSAFHTSAISFSGSMEEEFPVYQDKDLFPAQINRFQIPMLSDNDCDSDDEEIRTGSTLLSLSLSMAVLDYRSNQRS